jgi:uncharacterized membrane protein
VNHFTATRWIAILAFSLSCLHSVRANAGSLEVCNDGEVTVKTALAETFNPFSTGTSFEVSGWYNVEPHKCSQLYDGGLANGLYVGFAYQDRRNTIRAHISTPSEKADNQVPVSNRFCVALGAPFDYTTRLKTARSCVAGSKPLAFSLFYDFSTDDADWTYTVRAYGDEDGEPLGPVGQ